MAKRRETPNRASSRSAARLAAVQALYQMDMTGIDLTDVIAEFVSHRLGEEIEGCEYADVEPAFFRDLVEGVVRDQLAIDPLIDQQLAEGWRLTRVDSILRAILRAGAYEITVRGDVPARVVISEYVDIAHAFFAEDEPKVVNGILDRLGHKSRPQEFVSGGTSDG
jgi:N utilization substance protein B